MKVVINKCFGGFGLSKAAYEWMAERGQPKAQEELAEWAKRNAWVQAFLKDGKWPEECSESEAGFLAIDAKYRGEASLYGHGDGIERHDPLLVQVVEALGEEADGEYAKLKVVEVPEGVDYEIGEYDGMEHIAEKHRTWT